MSAKETVLLNAGEGRIMLVKLIVALRKFAANAAFLNYLPAAIKNKLIAANKMFF